MKKIAKLTVFFSFTFAVLFAAAMLVRFLSAWVEMAGVFPPGVITARSAEELSWGALTPALYLAVLFSLSYAARREISLPVSMLCVGILAFAFSSGFSLGISRQGALGSTFAPAAPLQAGPGLVLSQSTTSFVLLRSSEEAAGPRVVSFAGSALIYQETPLWQNNRIIPLPPLQLGTSTPLFIRSLDTDLRLGAAELRSRLEDNFLLFAAYVFALILLLCSLRFLLDWSSWPLANLFLAALFFRGVLSLEAFLNMREVNLLLSSFFDDRIPLLVITPLAFTALAVLIILYSMLSRLARARKNENV